MKNLAVIMPDSFSASELKRKSYFIKEYFKDRVNEIIYYIPQEVENSFLSLSDKLNINRVETFSSKAEKEDILLFYKSETRKDYHPLHSKFLPGQHSREVYTLEIDGRIRASVTELEKADYPHMNTHAFNTLGPKTPDGEFYYFPYGYLFKYPGLGPINPFGFRIPDNYENLQEREKNHKLILFFGGSAMWSMYSYVSEMFPAVLEKRLNEWSEQSNSELKFTVLNFGMHGHVVLNEMITYMLFCQKLSPDYIIAHDGWNDLLYGMISDTFLLNEHQLVYQYNLEYWSQILHKTNALKPTQPTGQKFSITNLPNNIIEAYVVRKKQFKNMVEKDGAKFVWGLQPSLYSKKSYSEEEERYLKNELNHTNIFREPYKRMSFIYKEYLNLLSNEKNIDVFNVHEKFEQYGSESSLFGDIIHTTPLGDEKIAEHYFEYFTQHLLENTVLKKEAIEIV